MTHSLLFPSMKVTINFRGTKIVVPCGEGDISVRELTSIASARYKKALGGGTARQQNDARFAVACLR